MLIRLDKYLADMQAGTRTQVKEYIRKGQVSVDGVTVLRPEHKVDTDAGNVTLNGSAVGYAMYEYYMLNKPSGVISASSDPREKTVVDLIDTKKRGDLFPVGRLDRDTEGLLLITNDGELSHRLLSPRHHVDKTYFARVRGHIGEETVRQFREGLVVDESLKALPAALDIIEYDDKEDCTCVYVILHEGKFHQIKRMFERTGSEVLYLKRLSMGSLRLDERLKPGEFRALSRKEIEALRR